MNSIPTTAVIVSDDDAHAFLLESLLQGQVDRVVHTQTTRAAIDILMRGLRPEVVLLDVALFAHEEDSAAAAATLRLVAGDGVVLEVGEDVPRSGRELALHLRGNSVEARDWVTLRR